jgi:hypothetical protein
MSFPGMRRTCCCAYMSVNGRALYRVRATLQTLGHGHEDNGAGDLIGRKFQLGELSGNGGACDASLRFMHPKVNFGEKVCK